MSETDVITIPVVPPAPAQPTAPTFTAEDIAAARQQEKDKLYKRLETNQETLGQMQSQLAVLTAEREAAETARSEAAAAAEAERVASVQAQMDAKSYAETRISEFEQRMAAMQAEREAERAVLAREREYGELQSYRAEQMQTAGQQIAPELIDLVSGNTREEIDASVALLTARTQAIVESIQTAQAAATPPRGVAPTGRPNVDPLNPQGPGTKTYTAQDLKSMSMGDYIANRSQLLGALSDQVRRNGLYG